MTLYRFASTLLVAGLIGVAGVAGAAGAQTAAQKTYIVQLADAPAATYAGSVGGLAATRPAPGARLDVDAPNVRAYVNHLDVQRASALARIGNAVVLHRYALGFNGFAARLTDAQARSLKGSAGVASVTESGMRQLDTTRTPGFLGLSAAGGLWSQLDAASRNVKGEDVVIGVIDSGVWPEDASFSDKVAANGKPVAYHRPGTSVYGPPPAKWKGVCQTGSGFTAAMCNNKLIGARFYVEDFNAGAAVLSPFEYTSPRDGAGHGSHTASTAGGNAGVDALIDGVAAGVISGIAPRARIAAYKVCWEASTLAATGCYDADTLKAIDDAISDGVEVINFSISGSQTSFVDPVEIGLFNASAAGIFVAASAGNNGPANQVAHIGPWLTTVAASTHDRYRVATLTLGSGAGLPQPNVVAPVLGSFSSRGPNRANANILKPDITAPGVDVIAGYIDVSLTQAQHDALALGSFTPQANASSQQGTSMSSPHVAGAAALLRQLHPGWTPAAIKSALMTSTNDVKLASGAADADRWGYGAGHLNPNAAAQPGLVYDAGPADYARFLCGLGLTPPAGTGTCPALGKIAPWNLNLASLTAADVPGTLTLTRRVTNVSGATATFVASTSLPGWTAVVSPASLRLAPGASASFDVALTRTTAAVGHWSFGSLTWSDGMRQVRSPLSARGLGFVAPAQISDTRASGSGTRVFTVVSAYDGSLSVAATGLVPATLNTGSVATNTVQCFDFSVAAGARLARFQLFNADTLGGSATDLDLDVYSGPGGVGTLVGSSGGVTSDEVVTLNALAGGTYSACVTGVVVQPTGATYRLSSWVVGPAPGTQTLRASAPSTVYAGGTASVAARWSVPAGKRYLGHLQYLDSASAPIGSSVVFVDNR